MSICRFLLAPFLALALALSTGACAATDVLDIYRQRLEALGPNAPAERLDRLHSVVVSVLEKGLPAWVEERGVPPIVYFMAAERNKGRQQLRNESRRQHIRRAYGEEITNRLVGGYNETNTATEEVFDEVVRRLEESDARILLLYLAGYTYDEIAARTDRSLSAVWRRVRSAILPKIEAVMKAVG